MEKKTTKANKPHKHHKKSDKTHNKKDVNGGKKSNLYDEDTFPASDPITKY